MSSAGLPPTMWSIADRAPAAPAALAALALAASLVAGCATPPAIGNCTPYDQQASRPAGVSMLSPELGAMIGVRDVSPGQTATRLPAIAATLYNCTDVDVEVLLRTRFTGERGQSEPPSAWRSVILAPRSEATYAENAVSPTSRRLAVEVIDARRAQQFYTPGQSWMPFSTSGDKR